MQVPVLLTAALGSLFLFTGCRVARQNNSTAVQSADCRNAPLTPGAPVATWQRTVIAASDPPPEGLHSRQFDSYTLRQEALDTFFFYAGRQDIRASFAIPLPEPLGCQYFEVMQANTLDEGLAEKFPGLVSLKGNALYNRHADLRLDYDGTVMHAQVTWDDAVYLVKPVRNQRHTAYVIYNRKDSETKKQPFEQQANTPVPAPTIPQEMVPAPASVR